MNGEDRGQTEVIGSVLLVAIVVISVSTYGAVYLSERYEAENQVVGEFDVSLTKSSISVEHLSGGSFAPEDVSIVTRSSSGDEMRLHVENGQFPGDTFDPGDVWTNESVSFDPGAKIHVFVVHEPSKTVLFDGWRRIPSNPPDATFEYSPSSPDPGQSVEFNASDSSDPDGGNITEYKWDFGDGTVTTTTNPTINHTFSDNESYTVTLTVTDDENVTDSVSKTVRVGDSPTASFSTNRTNPQAGELIEFDGSASADNDDGGASIDEYRWDFDGDDSVDETTTSATTTHAYGSHGTYNATLTVVDDEGQTNTTSKQIEVNATPESTFTYSPLAPNTSDNVTFDGGLSSDPDGGSIVEYRWEFGDGNSTTTSDATANHSYSSPGIYQVNLTVEDDENETTTSSQNVTVGDPPNATFTPPSDPDPNQTLTFDASGSSDPDGGSIDSYTWDFGDGNTTTTSSDTITHNYSAAGKYTVELIVVDDEDQTGSVTKTINVGDVPTATFTTNRSYPEPGDAIEFDASNSTDNGNIVEYRWDFDGDGDVDTTTTSATTVHTYNTEDDYTVTLTVEDDDGLTNSTSQTVSVSSDTTPPTVDVDDPDGGELLRGEATFTITWSASDSETSVDSIDLAYSTDNGSTWTSIATDETNDGSYDWTVPNADTDQALVRVTATDGAGNSASDQSDSTFTIDDSPPSLSSLSADDTSDPDGTANDGVVNDGDTVTVSATVSDSASGVSSVTVDASDFGAGSATLTDGNNDGVYDVTFTVDAANASADGSYALTVTATDNAGNTNTDDTGSVELDTTAPAVRDFNATNSSNSDIAVTFNSSEELSKINVTVKDKETDTVVTTLTETDFSSKTVSGTYVYNATYSGDGEKNYNVTLNRVVDTAGNENTTQFSDTVTADPGPPGDGAFNDADGDGEYDPGETTYTKSDIEDGFDDTSVDLVIPEDLGTIDPAGNTIQAKSITLNANLNSSGKRVDLIAEDDINITGIVTTSGKTISIQAGTDGSGRIIGEGANLESNQGIDLISNGDMKLNDTTLTGGNSPNAGVTADLGTNSATLYVAGASISDGDDTLVYDPDGITVVGEDSMTSGSVSPN